MRLAVFYFINIEKTSIHIVFKKVCDKINLKGSKAISVNGVLDGR